MSYKSIDLACDDCGHMYHDLVERELVDLPQQCPVCGKMSCKKIISMPNVARASYPDGHKRGGGYQELKEAAKLKQEAYNTAPEKRGAIAKEIRKLGGKLE